MYLCAVHCLLMDPHCNRYAIVCCLVAFAYHFLCLQVSCHFSFYYGVRFFLFVPSSVDWLYGGCSGTCCVWTMQRNDAESCIDSILFALHFGWRISVKKIKREFYKEKKISLNGRLARLSLWMRHRHRCKYRQKIGTKWTADKKKRMEKMFCSEKMCFRCYYVNWAVVSSRPLCLLLRVPNVNIMFAIALTNVIDVANGRWSHYYYSIFFLLCTDDILHRY